jgi:Mg2+ and Co2+ transporter CorA
MSKFADNLEDLSQRTAEYIRMIEKDREMLREEKNYLLHKAGENLAEIAELRDNLKRLNLAMQESDAENAVLKKQNLELLSIILDSFKVLGDKK